MIRPVTLCFPLVYLILTMAGVASHAADPQAGFQGYPEAPAFTVLPREAPLKNYPCMRCHDFLKVKTEPRQLRAPHPELDHGAGRFWCLECHDPENRNSLRTTPPIATNSNEIHTLCGRCHATQERDWYFGAHGKRVGLWQGEREILDCVRCHNPHQPAIQPRKPQPPPAVRSGLERPAGRPEPVVPIWEQAVDGLEQPREQQHE
ncbi:MAG: cytochrome C [Gammaproteobacteria bacterium]|nr:cytochrome C [Gammaproteobacteria bacterium]MCP5424242.1 cytochrome C [Gammaproteobacteria bacterium]MCP5458884.1 cytochrome C [Gammaproteobacteria bacterium]